MNRTEHDRIVSKFKIYHLIFFMTNLHSLFSIILGVRGRRRTHRSSTKVRTYAISNLTASVDENLNNIYWFNLLFVLTSGIIRQKDFLFLNLMNVALWYNDSLIRVSKFINMISFRHIIVCYIVIFSFYYFCYYRIFCFAVRVSLNIGTAILILVVIVLSDSWTYVVIWQMFVS